MRACSENSNTWRSSIDRVSRISTTRFQSRDILVKQVGYVNASYE